MLDSDKRETLTGIGGFTGFIRHMGSHRYISGQLDDHCTRFHIRCKCPRENCIILS